MRTGRATRRFGIALAAAWLLLVQALAGSFALAAGRQFVPLDAFGNPLCISSAGHDLPAPGADHGALPPCCQLGCAMGIGPAATPPQQAWVAAALPAGSDTLLPAVPDIAPGADDYDPGSPRAPPAAV